MRSFPHLFTIPSRTWSLFAVFVKKLKPTDSAARGAGWMLSFLKWSKWHFEGPWLLGTGSSKSEWEILVEVLLRQLPRWPFKHPGAFGVCLH